MTPRDTPITESVTVGAASRRPSSDDVPRNTQDRLPAPGEVDPEHQETLDFAGLMIGASMKDIIPDLELSADQNQRLAAATLRLRDAQQELERLPEGTESTERRSALEAEVTAASDEFSAVMNEGFSAYAEQLESGTDELDEGKE